MIGMRSLPVSIAIAMFLSGCAVTNVGGLRMALGSDAFSAYVEDLFRRQNNVGTELAFAIEDEPVGGERHTMLEAAELELLTACRGLNQIARAERDGESVGGFSALKRAKSAPDCERATDTAAALL